MRVGVVGAGFIAEAHVAAWTAEGVTASVFDPDGARASALAERFGVATERSFDDLIANVDIVDICTPTHRHAEIAIRAAAAGRHVICEKPLARTLDDAEAIVAACASAGVRLFVAHVVRYFPDYEAAHRIVAEGEIGEPAVLRLKRASFRPRRPAGHWLFDHALSGGLILDLMIHDFDYARWVAGDVVAVQCRSVGVERHELGVDHAYAILTHESGAISHVTGSWAYSAPTFRTSLEIACSRGLVEHDSAVAAPIVTYLLPRGPDSGATVGLPSSPLAQDPFRVELRDFRAAIASGGQARVTPRDGIEALRIALAADESARTSRVVRLHPATAAAAR